MIRFADVNLELISDTENYQFPERMISDVTSILRAMLKLTITS